MKNSLTWVVKSSKLCNLRCKYCYEWNSLADSHRIQLKDLGYLFEQTKAIARQFDATPYYIWHGGEPLLLENSYWHDLFKQQSEVYNSQRVYNSIQTNLTHSPIKKIDVLDRMTSLGVSFDPIDSLRQTSSGASSSRQVLKNMSLLRALGIKFGCITVVTKESVEKQDRVFYFFNDIGVNYRVLPFYRSANESQVDNYAIPSSLLIDFFKSTFDLWFSTSKGIIVRPLFDYLQIALRYLSDKPIKTYNKRQSENVLLIDTDGEIYDVGSAYEEQASYGNIFTNTVEEILGSHGRERAVERSERAQHAMCKTCPYSLYCSQWYVAEATRVERLALGDVCTAREVTSHILRRVRESNFETMYLDATVLTEEIG